jgi:hypothetical protein
MGGRGDPRWDVLLVVTSDRYGSELFGSIRRLIDAALRDGRSVQVWACGYSTMLTQRGVAADRCGSTTGEACCAASDCSAADQIGRLITEQAGRFSWLACQTCSDDRGAGEHIAGVPSPPLTQFHDYVDAAAKTIYIGGGR